MKKSSKLKKFLIRFLAVIIILVLAHSLYSYVKDSEIRKFNKNFYASVFESSNVNAEENGDAKTELPKNGQVKYNNESIPVLMYHSIGHAKLNPYVVTPEHFKDQMDYLKKNKYTTLSLDQLYNLMVKNVPVPKKSVVITFDDGYADNYLKAYPILKKYHFKATIFVISKYLNTGTYYLNTDQLKEMYQNGIDIQSHTVDHKRLASLSDAAQLKELKDSKETLEKLFDKKVDYIAYPFGSYNIDTLKTAKQVGYKMAFTIDGKWTDKSNGLLTLNRVFVSGFARDSAFITRVKSSWYLLKDFYF